MIILDWTSRDPFIITALSSSVNLMRNKKIRKSKAGKEDRWRFLRCRNIFERSEMTSAHCIACGISRVHVKCWAAHESFREIEKNLTCRGEPKNPHASFKIAVKTSHGAFACYHTQHVMQVCCVSEVLHWPLNSQTSRCHLLAN